jgi:hypothetical protein
VTASLRRTVIVTMAALGVAFILVWAASSGSPSLVGELPARHGATHTQLDLNHSQQPPSHRAHDVSTDAGPGATPLRWADDLGTLAALLAGLWVLAQVARAVLVAFGPRVTERQLVVDLDALPDVEAGRSAMDRDRRRQRDALASSDVRNGIVACWVLLEEAAAAAGVVRRPAETATEFVVRFLRTLDVDPRPVGVLARLYHEARFSTHPMGERARAEAVAALQSVHDDLARSGVTA